MKNSLNHHGNLASNWMKLLIQPQTSAMNSPQASQCLEKLDHEHSQSLTEWLSAQNSYTH